MSKSLGIVGFCQDIGASRRGVDMGPYAVRAEGLEDSLKRLGYDTRDYGNVNCITVAEADYLAEYQGEPNLKYLEPIRQNMLQLKSRVETVLEDGRMPVILGGDHSMAMGSVAGIQKKLGKKQAVLWVDAHGDFNTPESTESGNIHGMPLAVLTGRGDKRLLELGDFPGIREDRVVIFGSRDLDREEIVNLKKSKVTVITMRDILERGFYQCLNQALDIVCSDVQGFHLSFDMDSIDPTFCPGTGTPVPGGLVDREVLYLMERVHETGKLQSMDLVEVNPVLDVGNKTARFAVELICRALGKRTT